MARHTYNEHLKQVRFFRDLDDAELARIDQAATQLDFPAGEVLMRQGQVAHEMYVVVEGTLEVVHDGEVIAEIGPGSFAGEMALLTHKHRHSDVIAKTDVSVIHIDGRGFNQVLSDVPQIAVKMLPIVATRVVENSHPDEH